MVNNLLTFNYIYHLIKTTLKIMSPVVKNILAVIAGFIIGSLVNGGLVNIGMNILPPPEGMDVADAASWKSKSHLLEAKYFLFPFLAHALGSLVGAYTAARIAATHKMKFALAIGMITMLGGIAAIYLLGGPLWFKVVDLVLAYIPMAWIGGRLAGAK